MPKVFFTSLASGGHVEIRSKPGRCVFAGQVHGLLIKSCCGYLVEVRIPLMADSDSIPIADSVPCDVGHLARGS